MGEPTRVHERGCGACPDRGPGRESGGVVETFNLSGKLNTFLGPLVSFNGTFELEFGNDFSGYQYGPLSITVQGRPVFTQVAIVSSAGSILAHNSTTTLFRCRSMQLERGTNLTKARLVGAR